MKRIIVLVLSVLCVVTILCLLQFNKRLKIENESCSDKYVDLCNFYINSSELISLSTLHSDTLTSRYILRMFNDNCISCRNKIYCDFIESIDNEDYTVVLDKMSNAINYKNCIEIKKLIEILDKFEMPYVLYKQHSNNDEYGIFLLNRNFNSMNDMIWNHLKLKDLKFK